MTDMITVQVPVGLVYEGGNSVSPVDREIPADEAPPLPINAELSVVGKRTNRVDARLKATGAAQYTADIHLPGMLYGRVVRSAHPHARSRSIDTSAAMACRGVRAVHVLEHLRDSAVLEDPSPEIPSSLPIVRYIGVALGRLWRVPIPSRLVRDRHRRHGRGTLRRGQRRIATAAAIANTVYNAIEARVRELPMTPARVLEALAQKDPQ